MNEGDEDLREQLEISKEFLEYHHGSAIRSEQPDQAYAYYEAIGLVEDALEHNWAPEKGPDDEDLFWDHIDRSRAAREEGFEAATLREQQREERRQEFRSPSAIDWLLPGGEYLGALGIVLYIVVATLSIATPFVIATDVSAITAVPSAAIGAIAGPWVVDYISGLL